LNRYSGLDFIIANNQLLLVTIGYSLLPDEAPYTNSIEVVHSEKKEAHVCILDGCLRGKRGNTNYCREHKSIGRIIEGKIAREKANRVDPSISMYEEALRIQKSPSWSVLFDELMKIIFYKIIIFFLFYITVIMPIQGLAESSEDQRWYS